MAMVRIREFKPKSRYDFDSIDRWYKIPGPEFQNYVDMTVDLYPKKFWMDEHFDGIWAWTNCFERINIYQVMICIQLKEDVVLYKMRWL